MGAALDALIDHSQRLLAAVRAGTEDETLAAWLHDRMQRVREFETAAAGGERSAAAQIRKLQEVEREIEDTLQQRGELVYRELMALRHARTAERAYGAPGERAP